MVGILEYVVCESPNQQIRWERMFGFFATPLVRIIAFLAFLDLVSIFILAIMRLYLPTSIVAIAGSIAELLYASPRELYPRHLVTGNAGFSDQYVDKASNQVPDTKLGLGRSEAKPTKTAIRTILPRGNCAGKPCSSQSPSDQRSTGRKSGGLSFSIGKPKSSIDQGTISRQPSSGNPPPQSHLIEQTQPVGPSRTEHIQNDKSRPYPIPFPNFIKFDQAAARARPSRGTLSSEFKNPSKNPMSMKFKVHGPGTVSLTSEHENSYSTESYNVKKGDTLSKNIKSKYGTRVQGTTETGAQFDLAAQRAYMGLHSHDENGSANSRAWGPDEFSRKETIQGKGRSEVELKSHANQQFVGASGKLKGNGGFHAHSTGIPFE